MVKIRFRRVGKKKQPSYRIVVADSRDPRDGRFIETIGHYNPRTEPPTIVVKEDKVAAWMKEGAQPSESVRKVLASVGILPKIEYTQKAEQKTEKKKA